MSEAPALAAYLGNQPVKDALLQALQKGSLPHAVILAAPDGCGRNFLARCLAADYLFPEGGEGAAAVLRGESSEVLLVEGEGPSGQIKIDRVRQVRSDMYRTGLSSAGRVVLIRDAERMMAPAANALLKVLEEPPGEVLFLLTARDAFSLPATIRSRCAVYPLAEMGQGECEAALRARGAENTAFLAAVYGGRLGLCLRAAEDPERGQSLQNALAAAKALAKADCYALFCLFALYDGREEKERRNTFLSDLAAVLAASLRGGLPTGQNLPLALAAAALPLVQDAQRALQANAAAKLVFTALALRLSKLV